jgi:hypothetical protein
MLYDRTRERCGYCDGVIPNSLQFSPAEKSKLDADRRIWDDGPAKKKTAPLVGRPEAASGYFPLP